MVVIYVEGNRALAGAATVVHTGDQVGGGAGAETAGDGSLVWR